MRPNRYMLIATGALLALFSALPAQAQDYGVGVAVDVPYVEPGTITLDGVGDEAAWDDALEISLIDNWDGEWSGHPVPDVDAYAKLLFSDGVLYVLAAFEDYQPLAWHPGEGEQILVGIDPVYEPGVTDNMVDDGWAGWADYDHAPDAGPYTYKIWIGNDSIPAISMNYKTDKWPADSGWVAGPVVVNEADYTWGFEIAIYAPQIQKGGKIGFNMGGSTAEQETIDEHGSYAWFSWQAIEYPGGDVMHTSASFATLSLGGDISSEAGPRASGFVLDAAYPNPFRAATTLSYELAEAGDVELAIYDVLGRRVAVIEGGARAAGQHTARLEGAHLADGVYLARLAVDGAVVATRSITRIH